MSNKREILVRRMRHFRGDIGDSLNIRALDRLVSIHVFDFVAQLTLLEYSCPIDLYDSLFGVFNLFGVAHGASCCCLYVNSFGMPDLLPKARGERASADDSYSILKPELVWPIVD